MSSILKARRLSDGTQILPGRRQKVAAIGGEHDQQFEQSFASLAYTYIQDKAPALLDYMVGFQLVDRNDDNNKACGVFGFKLGNSWLYAPVFFLKGDMKGHELLYLKNQDTFVPLKENWINYILNKRPHVLGHGQPGSLDQMGVLQPDIQSLSQPPETGKFASRRPPVFKPWSKSSNMLPWLAKAAASDMRKYAGLAEKLDLRHFLQQSPVLVKLALQLRQRYPGIKEAMDGFYGPDLLKNALLNMRQQTVSQAVLTKRSDLLPGGLSDNKVTGSSEQLAAGMRTEREHTSNPRLAKEIASDHLTEDPQYYTHLRAMERKQASVLSPRVPKQAAADPVKKVKVITDQAITENEPTEELSEQEKEQVLNKGYLVKDYRTGEEVSVAYNTQIVAELTNPDKTGVYDVLTAEGKFERCLVIVNPHAGDGRKNFCVLVRLGDGEHKAHENVHATRVFIRPNPQPGRSDIEEFVAWYDKLPDTQSVEQDGEYVIVTKRGDGTCVFAARNDLGEDCRDVNWRTYCDVRASYMPPIGVERYNGGGTFYDSPCCSESICFGKRRGPTMKSVNGVMYLPDECKVISVSSPPNCSKCGKKEHDCTCEYFHRNYEKRPVIRPGDLAAIQTQLIQKSAAAAGQSSVYQIKVWADNNEIVIDRQRYSKLAALRTLVEQHNLREKQASQILKEAVRGRINKYIVKRAQPSTGVLGPYSTGEGGYSVPMNASADYTTNYAYADVPIQKFDQGRFMEVPEMNASLTDPSVYDPMQNIDPHAMQTAQQAYQNNQKEVFDTTMVSSMLNAVRQDSLVDRYLGDLTKALDRLGRILFMFYWHNEEFSERYGKQDLPELEDTIRNAFEGLGDLTLFLKQKTVESMQFGEPTLNAAADR